MVALLDLLRQRQKLRELAHGRWKYNNFKKKNKKKKITGNKTRPYVFETFCCDYARRKEISAKMERKWMIVQHECMKARNYPIQLPKSARFTRRCTTAQRGCKWARLSSNHKKHKAVCVCVCVHFRLKFSICLFRIFRFRIQDDLSDAAPSAEVLRQSGHMPAGLPTAVDQRPARPRQGEVLQQVRMAHRDCRCAHTGQSK